MIEFRSNNMRGVCEYMQSNRIRMVLQVPDKVAQDIARVMAGGMGESCTD
jgi:hypothetical protein